MDLVIVIQRQQYINIKQIKKLNLMKSEILMIFDEELVK